MPTARPLGDWIAVEPEFQGEGDVQDAFSGLWLPEVHKAWADAVYATVLAVGRRAPVEIQPGQRVVFQRFSGHPGQTDPLAAEVFGGSPGRFAALVRVVDGPIIEHLEEQRAMFLTHINNLEKLNGAIHPQSEARRVMLLDYYRAQYRRVFEILARSGGLRSRRHHPIETPWSVGRGLEAVVEG